MADTFIIDFLSDLRIFNHFEPFVASVVIAHSFIDMSVEYTVSLEFFENMHSCEGFALALSQIVGSFFLWNLNKWFLFNSAISMRRIDRSSRTTRKMFHHRFRIDPLGRPATVRRDAPTQTVVALELLVISVLRTVQRDVVSFLFTSLSIPFSAASWAITIDILFKPDLASNCCIINLIKILPRRPSQPQSVS